MIGIVVITHGALGAELVAAVEHMLGPQDRVFAIGLASDDDMAKKRCEVSSFIDGLACDDGVLILTDIVGGTPSNLAHEQLPRGDVAVLTGANMPMLVTAIRERRNSGLYAVAREALEAARKYMGLARGLSRGVFDGSRNGHDGKPKSEAG